MNIKKLNYAFIISVILMLIYIYTDKGIDFNNNNKSYPILFFLINMLIFLGYLLSIINKSLNIFFRIILVIFSSYLLFILIDMYVVMNACCGYSVYPNALQEINSVNFITSIFLLNADIIFVIIYLIIIFTVFISLIISNKKDPNNKILEIRVHECSGIFTVISIIAILIIIIIFDLVFNYATKLTGEPFSEWWHFIYIDLG
jgi:hypothetical protein